MDMSVVIVAHHEGRLMHPTLTSVFRSRDFARRQDISSEIVIVLDQSDEKTWQYIGRYRKSPDIQITETGLNDTGLSRNIGISLSTGRYITILDAQDLICQNWICAAITFLKNCSAPEIAHPEYLVEFDGKNTIRHLTDSTDPSFPVSDLFVDQVYGGSLCSAPKNLLCHFPYLPVDRSAGFGFADRHFTCETIGHGISHRIIPQTVGFIRNIHRSSFRTMRPSRLFETDTWNHLIDAFPKQHN